MAASDDGRLAIRVIRLEAVVQGMALGVMSGLAIFLATIVLIVRGGPKVGPHLVLLGQFLPGYAVTLTGAFVGLGWGFAGGFAAGYLVSTLYNRIAMRRGTLEDGS